MSSIDYLRVVHHWNIGEILQLRTPESISILSNLTARTGRPRETLAIGLPSGRHFVASCESRIDGAGSSLGRSVALGYNGFPSVLRARSFVWSSICLEVAKPPLPFSGRGNSLATTQLCPANGEQRQLHGRTQAREFSGSKLSKRHGLEIILAHDAMSSLCPNWRGVFAGPRAKKNPRSELGV